MELEELKQQWDILHKKLDEQEIINKRLMENVVNQKIDFISTYNWIGIAIGIIGIPLMIFINQQYSKIDQWLLITTIGMLVFFVFLGIYKALKFDKIKLSVNDIVKTEKFVLQQINISFWYYLITLVVVFGFLIASTIIFYDRLVAYNRLWFFIAIIVFGIIAGLREMRWYLNRMNKLHQSISDLKEFQKE